MEVSVEPGWSAEGMWSRGVVELATASLRYGICAMTFLSATVGVTLFH
jgi:hypothetical protein